MRVLALALASAAAVAVVSGMAAYFRLRPTKNNLCRRAILAHKKGETFYEIGDFEMAGKLYAKAESLRERTRQI